MINPSNILWTDSNQTIRKWIDQRTGYGMEHDQWAEDHGIHVGYCNRHKVKVWDETCDECENEDNGWLLCGECEEYRYEDARVEGGLKCGVCAYG